MKGAAARGHERSVQGRPHLLHGHATQRFLHVFNSEDATADQVTQRPLNLLDGRVCVGCRPVVTLGAAATVA